MSSSGITVMHNGNEVGPFSPSQVQLEVARGNLKGDDQGWCEGMAAWQPLYQFVAGIKDPSLNVARQEHATLSDKLDSLRNGSAYAGLRRALILTKVFALILLILGMIAFLFDDFRVAGAPLLFTSLATLFWSYLVEILIDIADAVVARSS